MAWNTNIPRPIDSRGGGDGGSSAPEVASNSLWTMDDLFVLNASGSINDDNLDQFVEPTPLLTDFIEIGLLAVVFLVGTPLNLVVLFKLIAEYRKRTCSMLQVRISVMRARNIYHRVLVAI